MGHSKKMQDKLDNCARNVYRMMLKHPRRWECAGEIAQFMADVGKGECMCECRGTFECDGECDCLGACACDDR